MTLKRTIVELASIFLKLGITAFGGPAAHIAMMRSEVVDRKGWLTDTEFLDRCYRKWGQNYIFYHYEDGEWCFDIPVWETMRKMREVA